MAHVRRMISMVSFSKQRKEEAAIFKDKRPETKHLSGLIETSYLALLKKKSPLLPKIDAWKENAQHTLLIAQSSLVRCP